MTRDKISLKIVLALIAIAACLSISAAAEEIVLPLWCHGSAEYCRQNGWPPVPPHVPRPIPQAPPDRPIPPITAGVPVCSGVPCGVPDMPKEVRGWIEVLLKGRSTEERGNAAEVLGGMRAAAVSAVPALLFAGADDPYYEVRSRARLAVKQIDAAPSAEEMALAVRTLEHMVLYSNAPYSRCNAAVALEQLGCAAVPAVPALREGMNVYDTNNDSRDRMMIAEAHICGKCECPFSSVGNGVALQWALAADPACPGEPKK